MQCLRLKWIEYGDFYAELDFFDNPDSRRDDFGYSVSLSADGNTVAIGAPGHDHDDWGLNSDSGIVRILRFDDQTRLWTQLGIDIVCCARCNEPENLNLSLNLVVPMNGCGGSVSLSSDGNMVAIGAFGVNWDYPYGNEEHPGRVEMYKYDEQGNSWIQQGRTIMGDTASGVAWNELSPILGEFNGRIGYSISLSNDGMVVAIGAPFISDDPDGDLNTEHQIRKWSGKVRVYQWDGYDWIPLGLNTPLAGAMNEAFGKSISISSSEGVLKVAIGAPSRLWELGPVTDLQRDMLKPSHGYVRVYQYINESVGWVQLGTDIFSSNLGQPLEDAIRDVPEDLDRFGFSVSLSENGTRLAVGAPYRTLLGQVFVYEYDGCEWAIVGDPISGERLNSALEDGHSETHYLGMSVSLSADGNTVASASIPYSTKHFYVHQYDGSSWEKIGETIVGYDDQGDLFRIDGDVSLSADGTKVAVGMPFEDGHGRVRLFSFGGTCPANPNKPWFTKCNSDCPDACASGLECKAYGSIGYTNNPSLECIWSDPETQQLGDACWTNYEGASCAEPLECTGM